MIKLSFKYNHMIYLVAISSLLLTTPGLRAQESRTASEVLTDGTEEFLSDPAQAGSLLGTILAGAAIANPLAPIIGSVAGFFIGKSTDYSDRPDYSQRNAYANRSLIPDAGTQIATLSGLTGDAEPELQSGPIIALALDDDTIVASELADTRKTVVEALTEESLAANQFRYTEQSTNSGLSPGSQISRMKLQEQIASACTQIDLSQPMPINCYYYSQ